MDSYASDERAKTLPIATVQKIINEVLAANPGATGDSQTQTMTFAKETRDLLIECCVEFITMLSSEANDIAEKDAKKTIACEHITKALQELDFGEYVPELLSVADSFKTSQVVREMPFSGILYIVGILIVESDTREEAVQDRAERHDERRTHPSTRGAFQISRREI